MGYAHSHCTDESCIYGEQHCPKFVPMMGENMTTLNYPAPADDRTYYLSGPIAGNPETKQLNIERFIKAAADLRARGYKILSPIEVNVGEINPNAEHEWSWYMRRDIEAMMDDSVEGIIMLPGWEFSRGAQVELALAKALNFYVTTLGECLVRPVVLEVVSEA